MNDLTARQKEILNFIRARCAEGVPPTNREIGRAFGISSPNGVYNHLQTLQWKGYLEIVPSVSRGIRLTEQRGCCPTCGRKNPRPRRRVKVA
jgi:repressor LexA